MTAINSSVTSLALDPVFLMLYAVGRTYPLPAGYQPRPRRRERPSRPPSGPPASSSGSPPALSRRCPPPRTRP